MRTKRVNVAVLVAITAFCAGSASAQIYINAPLDTGPTSNSGVAAPAGTTWSECQNDAGNFTESNTLSGVSCSVTTTVFRCADDFVVPAGPNAWTVDAVIVYAYQTGFAGGTSPITGGTLRIWNQPPNPALTGLLCGDETTNVLASSTDATMYRLFNSSVPPPGTTPGTTRHIWRNELTVPAGCAGTGFFVPGTYWIDWNTSIGTSAHFAPPATVVGVRGLAGWNAMQFTATGWGAVIDAGNPATAPDVPLDFPFELTGVLPVTLQQFTVE